MASFRTRSSTLKLKTWRICLDIELCQLKNGSSSPTSTGTPPFFSSHCNQLIIPSLYAILNSGCFEEYRYFKYKLRYLNSFVPELYNGAECPLCPKENGTDSLKVLMPALVWQGRKQKVAIQFHQGMGIYCLVTRMMWIILLTIILTVDKSQWIRYIV
ncbi:uncharacterized protein LOC141881774 [Acropora palmata]|uniref:uncharacterized protein LOC141881774 n=1 Tax=Acropora palmata TaxID=6131 RepID=UPI003DA0ACDA